MATRRGKRLPRGRINSKKGEISDLVGGSETVISGVCRRSGNSWGNSLGKGLETVRKWLLSRGHFEGSKLGSGRRAKGKLRCQI